MVDPQEFRRRVIVSLAGSPAVLLPFLGGAATILSAWAVDASGGLPFFAGTALLLGSAGAFFTRLVNHSEAVGKAVIEEIEREAHATRESYLDDLGRRLAADDDERDDAAFHDLRRLVGTFHDASNWSTGVQASLAFDIMAKVDQLFEGSVRSLERNVELAESIRGLKSGAAKKPLVAERERILVEVGTSLEALGRLLADLRATPLAGAGSLDGIRRDLDLNLDLMKRVDERMREFDLDSPAAADGRANPEEETTSHKER